MATSIPQFLLGILLIVFISTAWVLVLLALLWVLRLFTKDLVKWILKHKWAERQVSKAREQLQRWWVLNKPVLIHFWEFVSEILIDPLFFGYVVFVLFNRLESLIAYTKANPKYSFWQILNLDMENDMNLYAWFILIFFVWMVGKGWAHRQQVRNQRQIAKILEAIAKKVGVDENEYRITSPKRNETKNDDAV